MRDHISINICTFRRILMLERLLRNIAHQFTDHQFDFSVVVVDNDPAASAEKSVTELRSELNLDITYAVEKERTIPAARNHALQIAKGNYVGIIDDDEFPPPHWLLTLYRGIQTFEVDGALGPVIPFFEQEPPPWLLKGRFCERPIIRTGTLLKWFETRTGNVLLKKSVFDKHGLKFDPKLKTSGSDRAFFKEAMGRGYKFVAVEEAPVYECIPPARWTKSYYLKRALVHGYNPHMSIKGDLHGFQKLYVPMKSVAALLAYLLALPVCVCLGTHAVMKCFEKGGHHLSQLLAMMGVQLVKRRDF